VKQNIEMLMPQETDSPARYAAKVAVLVPPALLCMVVLMVVIAPLSPLLCYLYQRKRLKPKLDIRTHVHTTH
jgi:hypothetical protein